MGPTDRAAIASQFGMTAAARTSHGYVTFQNLSDSLRAINLQTLRPNDQTDSMSRRATPHVADRLPTSRWTSGDFTAPLRAGQTHACALLAWFVVVSIAATAMGCSEDWDHGTRATVEFARDPNAGGLEGTLEVTPRTRMQRALESTHTNAFLLIERGRMTFEWYARTDGKRLLQQVGSLTKAVFGSVAIALAMDDGLIDPDGRVARYLPAWSDHPVRSKITLRQLANHSSGLAHQWREPRAEWADAFWHREGNFYSRLLREVESASSPGSSYKYSGPAWGVLSLILASEYSDVSTKGLEEIIRQRVMRPIGIPDSTWNSSFGDADTSGSLDVYALWSGASFQARTLGRVGQLFLHDGRWDGRQILSSEAIEEVTRDLGTPAPETEGAFHPAPTMGWWSNRRGAWPCLPRDAYAGAGARGEILLIIPSLDLVMVRLGRTPGQVDWGGELWRDLYQELFIPMARLLDEAIACDPHDVDDQG